MDDLMSTETVSPFALQEDTQLSHEPPEELAIVEAPPGNERSNLRRCSCLGVMPGRVCSMCLGTKWLKLCPQCKGEGRLYSQRSANRVARSETCGACRGMGQINASMDDVRQAHLEPARIEAKPEPFRRAARLANGELPAKRKPVRRKKRARRQASQSQNAT